MNIENFTLFAIATLLLNITPGNDMLYVATRSTNQGVKAGVVSALGIAVGCFAHIFAAVLGLSTILAKSALAFDVIKYSGAVYLLYLGIKSFIHRAAAFEVQTNKPQIPLSNVFKQGIVTNVLNPKVALFFLAFLPQFVKPDAANFTWQVLFLGIYFNFSGTIVNILVAILFGKVGSLLTKSPKYIQIQEKITGLVLIALGLKIALTSRR